MKQTALLALLAGSTLVSPSASASEPDKKEWIALFNGHDLDGWTAKIAGYAPGENFADTFRVEDGVLKVLTGQTTLNELARTVA